MAYVPGFEWDLFISYPRESDERDAYDFEWVSEFHRLLESEIKQRLASQDDPKFYFDQRNFGAGDHLDIDLLDAARKSALFVPIVSPRFVVPGKFTLRELEAFCESGNVSQRIVTIELLPVSSKEGRPRALCGPKRNEFFVREGKVPIKLTPRSDLYVKRVQIVAEEIKDLLQNMGRNAGKEVDEPEKPFSSKTVLLAEKQDGVDWEWEDIRSYIRSFGAQVLSAEESNDDLERGGGTFRISLKKADFFVQLLSPVDEANLLVEGKPSRAQLQYNFVVQHNLAANGGGRVPILQWRTPRIRPEALKHWDKKLLDSPDVAVIGLEEFKREIIKKELQKEREEPSHPPAPLPSLSLDGKDNWNKPYIYITADDADIKYAQDIKAKAESETLVGNCEIIAAKNRMKNFKHAIKITDIIVILYGAGNPEFVDEWLRTYERKKASGEAKPPELEALCWAPPRKGEAQMLRGPSKSFHRFGSEDAFSPNVIGEILDELRRRRNHAPGVIAT